MRTFRYSARAYFECLAWAEEGKSARDTGAILDISRMVRKHLEQATSGLAPDPIPSPGMGSSAPLPE